MLLELRAFRALHYLTGVVVWSGPGARPRAGRHTFGFRYDTLEGHIERGSEWFLLNKDHASGEIAFRIEAAWQPATSPTGGVGSASTRSVRGTRSAGTAEPTGGSSRRQTARMSATPPVGDHGIAPRGARDRLPPHAGAPHPP
jgi:hypothetical protein